MSAFDPKRTVVAYALCLRRSVEDGLKLPPLVGYPLEAIFSELERGGCTQSKTATGQVRALRLDVRLRL